MFVGWFDSTLICTEPSLRGRADKFWEERDRTGLEDGDFGEGKLEWNVIWWCRGNICEVRLEWGHSISVRRWGKGTNGGVGELHIQTSPPAFFLILGAVHHHHLQSILGSRAGSIIHPWRTLWQSLGFSALWFLHFLKKDVLDHWFSSHVVWGPRSLVDVILQGHHCMDGGE